MNMKVRTIFGWSLCKTGDLAPILEEAVRLKKENEILQSQMNILNVQNTHMKERLDFLDKWFDHNNKLPEKNWE